MAVETPRGLLASRWKRESCHNSESSSWHGMKSEQLKFGSEFRGPTGVFMLVSTVLEVSGRNCSLWKGMNLITPETLLQAHDWRLLSNVCGLWLLPPSHHVRCVHSIVHTGPQTHNLEGGQHFPAGNRPWGVLLLSAHPHRFTLLANRAEEYFPGNKSEGSWADKETERNCMASLKH